MQVQLMSLNSIPAIRFDSCIFKTNQHTDMHIQNASSINELKQYSCYKIKGFVKEKPHIIEGGHMFFTLYDESGEKVK